MNTLATVLTVFLIGAIVLCILLWLWVTALLRGIKSDLESLTRRSKNFDPSKAAY